MTVTEPAPIRTRTMRVPRSRGALSGLLLILLGAWGALIPFIGPYLNYSYQTDQTWHWTAARGWLEVLPGAVTAFGGLLLLVSAHRIMASFGGWLAALAGAWFVVGQTLAPLLHLGSVGQPLSQHDGGRAAAELGYFYGLGTVIVFLAAFALGRLAVVGLRDVRAAERDERRAAELALAEDDLARRQVAERDAAIRAEREAATRDAVPAESAATTAGTTRTVAGARSEPDAPYDAASHPATETTRYGSDVGSDYSPQYGADAARSPAHQAPVEDGR